MKEELEKIKALLSSPETFLLGAELFRSGSYPDLSGTLVTKGHLSVHGLLQFEETLIRVSEIRSRKHILLMTPLRPSGLSEFPYDRILMIIFGSNEENTKTENHGLDA